jgi:hypothetical protein
MGGVVPLGYRVENRQLLIEPAEAATVRCIFEKFLETRSTTEVVRWLRRGHHQSQGLRLHPQRAGQAAQQPDVPGRDRTQEQGQGVSGPARSLDRTGTVERGAGGLRREPARLRHGHPAPARAGFLLAGLVETDQGERLHTTFTTNVDGRRYAYYVPRHAEASVERHALGCIPAGQLDEVVLAQIHAVLRTPEMVPGRVGRGAGLRREAR